MLKKRLGGRHNRREDGDVKKKQEGADASTLIRTLGGELKVFRT